MQVVCKKCKSSKNCENCEEIQRLHMGYLCATCYKLTRECEMCKILREVDHHLMRRLQHEVDHQSRERKQEEERLERFPTEEEARANKLFFATTFSVMAGHAVFLMGYTGYVIGCVIGKSIRRWRNQDDSDNES